MPEDIQKKIDEHWEKVIEENPNLWNGDVTCISEYFEDDTNIKIVCQKSNYAHYIYDERVGLPQEYACVNFSAGAWLVTLDGFYVVGELAEITSYPYCLQSPGGNVEEKDISGKSGNIINAIKREVQEEINIDLDNKNQVKQSKLKYIYIPEGKVHGYKIYAKVILNMTAEEMEKHFEEYFKYLQKNNLEIEFGKIHLLKKEEALQKLQEMQNPQREYLQPLIKIDSKI